ncbi:MAG: AAA domain-containing protein, partial [Pirellulales bacterium]
MDEPIIVDTAHGFQGDERDVMIFSLVAGEGMPPGTIKWIHDPTTDSKNLLNVALTRARLGLNIVGNLEVAESAGGLLTPLARYVRQGTATPDAEAKTDSDPDGAIR